VTRLQESAYKVVEKALLPAFKRLQEFLKYEYSTKFRSKPGILSIPNGDKFYAAALKWHISTDQTPEEVHNIGMEEVEKLKEGVKEVITQLGLTATFKEFVSQMRDDNSQIFASKDEALAYYENILKKANTKLDKLFLAETLTEEIYSLRVKTSPLGTGGAIAYYEAGNKNANRPGTFYVKLEPLSAQKKFEATTLSLHEGNPGHNFQFAFNQHQKNLPLFMKNPMFARYSEAPSRFNMPTAHVEGWGLYSEYLGFEMDMYEDPYARFGHYSFNLLRACRLVVDTGIHALGWSREKAVNFMLENSAMSRASVESEVDRYITWPGQACAYKIGERKMRDLRGMAEEQLGSKFNIGKFHNTVLRCAGPLSALERCIRSFVEDTKSGKEDKMQSHSEVKGDTSGVKAQSANTIFFMIIMKGIVRIFNLL